MGTALHDAIWMDGIFQGDDTQPVRPDRRTVTIIAPCYVTVGSLSGHLNSVSTLSVVVNAQRVLPGPPKAALKASQVQYCFGDTWLIALQWHCRSVQWIQSSGLSLEGSEHQAIC